jgi:hypothetical protein
MGLLFSAMHGSLVTSSLLAETYGDEFNVEVELNC